MAFTIIMMMIMIVIKLGERRLQMSVSAWI